MPPYEALYGRKCRSLIYWDEVGERKVIGPELIQQTKEAVDVIRSRLIAAQDRQRKYADPHRKDVEFEVGEAVLLKVIGKVAYELALPPQMQHVHNVFHVSLLKKFNPDTKCIIENKPVEIEPDLSYIEQPVSILDRKDKVLRNKTVPLVRVLWRNPKVEESTWELENDVNGPRFQYLLEGPAMQVMTFESCKVNGYKFCTRSASGSSVIVKGTSHDNNLDYYGQLEEIVKLIYRGGNYVYLFKWIWFDSVENGVVIDKNRVVTVDITSRLKLDEIFIFASQASCYIFDDVTGI
ncbi:hypothetical protein DCAR_0519871 [Daucus carota subsp. sativus]|uniref:Chromo domain-containing protein n=1 Tax=Daucus carota subsp. sativus TaxID=79200 RepID=A0AAF0X2B9_DAUCS|nr:hypothetical protein DCAR_0519871 [Daucus carota subsp. sativus]